MPTEDFKRNSFFLDGGNHDILLTMGFLLATIVQSLFFRIFLTLFTLLELLQALEDELDAVEGAMLADVSSFNPVELMRFRRYLLSLRKSLFHEREILLKICRKDCPFIMDEAIFH